MSRKTKLLCICCGATLAAVGIIVCVLVFGTKSYRPYENISADGVDACYAKSAGGSVRLTDEQTDRLIEIIKGIKLKDNGKQRENDLVGLSRRFEIKLSDGKAVKVYPDCPDGEYLMDDTVYEAVDNKSDELKELFDSVQKT